MVGMPPDMGNDYARQMERRQMEEAYRREGRTGRPSHFLSKMRLGIGQKLFLLGLGFTALVVVLVLASALLGG